MRQPYLRLGKRSSDLVPEMRLQMPGPLDAPARRVPSARLAPRGLPFQAMPAGRGGRWTEELARSGSVTASANVSQRAVALFCWGRPPPQRSAQRFLKARSSKPLFFRPPVTVFVLAKQVSLYSPRVRFWRISVAAVLGAGQMRA